MAGKMSERSKITERSPQQQQRQPENGINESGGAQRINSNSNSNGGQGGSPTPPSSSSRVQSSESTRSSDPMPQRPDGIKENRNSNRTTKDKNEETVGHLREYDVLMGRGSGPNRHVGNIHFRAIVREVFDDFLDNHAGDGSGLNNRTEMLRIDPSTKNRLAQAVLDKITLEKKGRFLQKLTKKEILEATKKGTSSDLIRARANSMDAAAMAAEAAAAATGSSADSGYDDDSNSLDSVVNAVVYYKIIPEKQILAKIKQTFRFLRDQNEASYAAEKHRQRVKRMACRGNSRESSLPNSSSNALGNLNTSVLSGNSSLAAYALLSQNPHLGAVMNSNQLAQQLNFGSSGGSGPNSLNNSVNGLQNGNHVWTGRNRMGAAAASSLTSLNSLKNCTLNASGNMDLASRILCDLPQTNRIMAGSNSVRGSSSIFSGSPSQHLSVAMANSAQGLNNGTGGLLNKANSAPDQMSTKRVLEELTLSRLVHLQKQREETINAYLSLEREAAAPSSTGMGGINASAGNRISPFDRLLDNMNGNGSNTPATVNASVPQSVSSLNMGAIGGINSNSNSVGGKASDSLTLLLQLQNNGFPTNLNINHQHSLRAFGSL